MLAALITGKDTVELREFPDPTPAPTGVVVDIAFCGICGTDVHAYQSGRPTTRRSAGTSGRASCRRSAPRCRRSPRATGSSSRSHRRVAGVRRAHRGQTDRCEVTFLSALGRDPLAPPHGGFAPRIAVAAARVVATDPTLTDEQAAQVEPTTVAFHAVRTDALRLGDIAVIQGAGPIGLGTMQWVRATGAGQVIVVEPNEQRPRARPRTRCSRGGRPRRGSRPGDPRTHTRAGCRHRLRVCRAPVRRPVHGRSRPAWGSDVPDRPRRQRRVDLTRRALIIKKISVTSSLTSIFTKSSRWRWG